MEPEKFLIEEGILSVKDKLFISEEDSNEVNPSEIIKTIQAIIDSKYAKTIFENDSNSDPYYLKVLLKDNRLDLIKKIEDLGISFVSDIIKYATYLDLSDDLLKYVSSKIDHNKKLDNNMITFLIKNKIYDISVYNPETFKDIFITAWNFNNYELLLQCLDKITPDSELPVVINCGRLCEINFDKLKIVQELIKNNVFSINDVSYYLSKQLKLATTKTDDFFSTIIGMFPEVVNLISTSTNLSIISDSFIQACSCENVGVIKFILDGGYDIDPVAGYLALLKKKSSNDILKLILDKYPINDKVKDIKLDHLFHGPRGATGGTDHRVFLTDDEFKYGKILAGSEDVILDYIQSGKFP